MGAAYLGFGLCWHMDSLGPRSLYSCVTVGSGVLTLEGGLDTLGGASTTLRGGTFSCLMCCGAVGIGGEFARSSSICCSCCGLIRITGSCWLLGSWCTALSLGLADLVKIFASF